MERTNKNSLAMAIVIVVALILSVSYVGSYCALVTPNAGFYTVQVNSIEFKAYSRCYRVGDVWADREVLLRYVSPDGGGIVEVPDT